MSALTTSSPPLPSSPNPKLTLLTLPLEIRHLIYRFALPTSSPITICKSKTKPCPHLCPSRRARCNRQTILELSNDKTLTLQLNLLFTSRQTAAEALPFYHSTAFTFRSVECVGHLCARLGRSRARALKQIVIEGDDRLSFDERDELLPTRGEAARDLLPRTQRALVQRIRETFLDADAVVEIKRFDGRTLNEIPGFPRVRPRAGRPMVGRPMGWSFGAHARGGR